MFHYLGSPCMKDMPDSPGNMSSRWIAPTAFAIPNCPWPCVGYQLQPKTLICTSFYLHQMFNRLIDTSERRSTILIRATVCAVFLSEGIQKFLFPICEAPEDWKRSACLKDRGGSEIYRSFQMNRPRYPSNSGFAMGRRHDLPRALATVHAGQGIPLNGILLTGAIVLVLTLVGSLELVLRAATFSILLFYTITNLSALKQPVQEQLYGRWIPVLGWIGCL